LRVAALISLGPSSRISNPPAERKDTSPFARTEPLNPSVHTTTLAQFRKSR
jgi:hypothetical protein